MDTSPVLAAVGTTTIRESDVTATILSMGARGESYNNPQGRAAVLEKLIEQALFLTDARKNMLEYDPAFKAQLQKVKDDLLVQFAIQKTIEKVNVSDEEIRKFFDENPEEFAGQETVRASHILVSSQEEAEKILASIQNGEITFEDAAKQFSSCPSAKNGGSLGDFTHGQMVPEFDEACFSMEVGELRGPVQTQFGFHLIRLDEKKDGEPIKFSDARDAIREHLRGEKSRAAYEKKVSQMKIMYPVNR